ncbi:MAG: tRNA (N(6)-L-threonylcarbamoyladenosine(37)-C(2))-methylthiotransferase MtaB [Brevinematales bacterium]|nr:tRNA (N(6)-L-threonylcarbamoyladenosine(37)-C(2))-methylthiotransferase MtaB [Brevinematales bacterium]
MKVFVETIGCKLNQFESEALSERFKENGFKIVENIEDSDIVIVNSCTVTNRADAKSRNLVNRAKKVGKFVVLTGCYATTDFDKLGGLIDANLIVKNENKFSIPLILKNESLDTLERDIFPFVSFFEKTRAFIKIQDGCNNFCSYCKIPLARGRSISLEPEKILKFAKDLISKNYREIVITGVNISDYNYQGFNLYDLVSEMIKIEGEYRIRLSSLQPDEFDLRFVDLLNNEKFSPHFHISLQSGSDSVLKRMNRNYTVRFFMDIVNLIFKNKKDIGLSTDIIVGFPEESENEFNETLELIDKINFSRLHIFTYSRREKTKAFYMKDLPSSVKKEREKLLKERFEKNVKVFVEKEILNKPQKVLIEQEENNLFTGYTGNYFKIYSGKKLKENEFYMLTPRKYVIKNTEVELYE